MHQPQPSTWSYNQVNYKTIISNSDFDPLKFIPQIKYITRYELLLFKMINIVKFSESFSKITNLYLIRGQCLLLVKCTYKYIFKMLYISYLYNLKLFCSIRSINNIKALHNLSHSSILKTK